jgi:D-xylose transport system permease protein
MSTTGAPAATAPAPDDTAARATQQANVFRRILQGDLASVRVIFAIAVIWAIFQIANDRFLTAINLTNLMLQITAVGLISVGVVFVLLLGEIDLSIGAVSGLCAAIVAVLNVKNGWAPIPALIAGIGAGMVIGLVQGSLSTGFGIPSFVVTLAGLLAFQGFLLLVLGETGTVNINDDTLVGLANTFYSDEVGWIVAIVVIGLYAGVSVFRYVSRRSAGLGNTQELVPLIVRISLVAAAVIAAIAILNSDRGLPLAVIVLIAFVAGGEYIATRTGFGRHVFGVGGNAEAARRAGISVHRVRIAVFAISGTMAAIGGIFAASRLLAVNQSSGASDLLLLAIAGPVIAGTSLFGGRGSVWSALLGALVIGSISNGMDLLALESSVKFIVTGAVLLAAVIIDAVARRSRQAAGRV